jgi:amidase
VFEDWEAPHDALEVLLQDRYGGMYDNFVRDHGIDILERREDVTEEVVGRSGTSGRTRSGSGSGS